MDFETYALKKEMTTEIPRFRSDLLERHIRSTDTVLDVGCGDGVHLDYMSHLTDRQRLYGTEISRIRTERVRAKGFRCAKVDSCSLPFDDGTFNVVTIFEVLEHLEPSDASFMLHEIYRVLSDEGVVIGSTPNYPTKLIYGHINGLLTLLRAPFKGLNAFARGPAPSSRNVEPTSAPIHLYDKLKSLFSDDPTHIYRLNFVRLERLAIESSFRAQLYRTIGNRPEPANSRNYLNLLSRKVAFVLKKVPAAHERVEHHDLVGTGIVRH